MIRQIIILLTLLVVIGSCKAQDNSSNNIKKTRIWKGQLRNLIHGNITHIEKMTTMSLKVI